jgi:hypothetical protein
MQSSGLVSADGYAFMIMIIVIGLTVRYTYFILWQVLQGFVASRMRYNCEIQNGNTEGIRWGTLHGFELVCSEILLVQAHGNFIHS